MLSSFLFHSVRYKKGNVFVSCNIHSYALVSKWSWPEPCVSSVGSEDQNGNILKPWYRSSSLLVVYILHRQWALLNQKELHNKSCETKRLRATKCPRSSRLCDGLASSQMKMRRCSIPFSCEKTWTYFWSSPFQKSWGTIICLNILLLLGNLKCIIRVWNGPCTASLALWNHSHSWTTTIPCCLPMVMVGMIKSLTSSVFTIQFQKGRKPNWPQTVQPQNGTAYDILLASD